MILIALVMGGTAVAISSSLWEELVRAKSQPSRAYRTAQAGIDAADQTLAGFLKGQAISDSIRNRQLQRQTLGEALPGMVSDELTGLPVDQARNLVPLALAKAQLDKVNQPDKPYVPTSLDALLAHEVYAGKRSLSDAARLKASMSPSIFPKPEPGMRFDARGNLVPIPGGTTERKFAEEDAKKQASIDAKTTEANLVINKINEALNQVDSFSAGAGAATKNVPIIGQLTGATDLAANIDTIISSLGIGKLMEMKANSKAGASGMGALSDREMNLLTSALTSLKQSQNPAQLKKHLGEVKTHYQNILQLNQGINPFGDGLGDPEADAAIARVQSAPISDAEKNARIAAIRARAMATKSQ